VAADTATTESVDFAKTIVASNLVCMPQLTRTNQHDKLTLPRHGIHPQLHLFISTPIYLEVQTRTHSRPESYPLGTMANEASIALTNRALRTIRTVS